MSALRRLIAGLAVAVVLLESAWAQAQEPVTVTVRDLLELYDIGDTEAVRQAITSAARGDLRVVVESLERDGARWVTADGDGNTGRRRVAAAAFALEMAEAGLDAQWLYSRDLIEWACGLLRQEPARTEQERTFHLAAIALLEGSRDLRALDAHLAHVRTRFPDEPRVLLAVAFKSETEYWRLFRNDSGSIDGGQTHLVVPALVTAGARAENAREVALRLGFLALQDEAPERALAELRKVLPGDDAAQVYLAHLFSGWAHDARNDEASAVASYRAALAVLPHGQSATLHLAARLFASGRREEAETLVEGMLAAPAAVDPWRIFGYGDLRRFPLLLERLREAIR